MLHNSHVGSDHGLKVLEYFQNEDRGSPSNTTPTATPKPIPPFLCHHKKTQQPLPNQQSSGQKSSPDPLISFKRK